MTFQEIISKAVSVRKQFSQFEKQQYGRSWTAEDLVHGFVGDVGDLSKLALAKKGVRAIENVDEKLQHELADCLWSIITIAEAYDVDLEDSFLKTMEDLEKKLHAKTKNN